MMDSPWRFLEGHVIGGRYELKALFGVGPVAGVYLADDRANDVVPRVAVKLMVADTETERQRQLEALTHMLRMGHPNILSCFDTGETRVAGVNLNYLVMEVGDQTLAERMDIGPVSASEASLILRSVAAALAYTHHPSHLVVHRNIKPQNVIHADDAWKLADVGLLPPPAGVHSVRAGTVATMAPEAFEGVVSPAWDIWSFGVLMVQIVAGRLPFPDTSAAQYMRALISGQADVPPMPEPFGELARRCLNRDRSHRPSAAELLEALGGAFNEEGEATAETSESALPFDSAFEGTTIVVGREGSQFRKISDAVQHAAPGARIMVRPGEYREEVVVDRPVEITGYGPKQDILITSQEGSCIKITASKATLRGVSVKRLKGLREEEGYAIEVVGCAPLIEDCDVTSESHAAIAVRGQEAHPVIRKCTVSNGNAAGIFLDDHAHGTVEDCEISHNASSGVHIAHQADPVVRRCHIHSGQASGLFVNAQGVGQIEDCIIENNALTGVYVAGQSNPTIRRCSISGGKSDGVWVNAQGFGAFEECDIFGHTKAGVHVTDHSDPVFRKCRIHDCRGDGIMVNAQGRGTFEDCDVTGNEESGIDLNERANSSVFNCRLTDNGEQGVLVRGMASLRIENCTISGNKRGAWSVALGGRVKRLNNTES